MPEASGLLVAKLRKIFEDEKGDFEALDVTLSIEHLFWQNNHLKFIFSSIEEQL